MNAYLNSKDYAEIVIIDDPDLREAHPHKAPTMSVLNDADV